MAKDAKVQITVEVPATVAQWVRREAERRGTPLSQEVSRALFLAYANLDVYLQTRREVERADRSR